MNSQHVDHYRELAFQRQEKRLQQKELELSDWALRLDQQAKLNQQRCVCACRCKFMHAHSTQDEGKDNEIYNIMCHYSIEPAKLRPITITACIHSKSHCISMKARTKVWNTLFWIELNNLWIKSSPHKWAHVHVLHIMERGIECSPYMSIERPSTCPIEPTERHVWL